MFEVRNKGKIIIQIESENEKVNSSLVRQGIAKKPEIALTTLLINFVSLCVENDKDPKELIEKHLNDIIRMVGVEEIRKNEKKI
jgi:hypothetical protein